MKTGIQTAQKAEILPVRRVTAVYGITENGLEPYDRCKAKLTDELWGEVKNRSDGKLVPVTAISPTPAGEDKTTTGVGLGDALKRLEKKTMVAPRESPLEPRFGIRGGVADGGYAQVVPMEDLDLYFTGDFHVITPASNLLTALLDNHIQQGNALGTDTRQTLWRRCFDMSDQVLRNMVVGLGAKADDVVREGHLVITVASEIMAILCLASDMDDLKERLRRIIVVCNYVGESVTVADSHAVRSTAAPLKNAIKPSIIQTLKHTGALVHGDPFANTAHDYNGVRAAKTALGLASIMVMKAGSGVDLGAEKFLDIKCHKAGLKLDAVALIAMVRVLKYNGNVPKSELGAENLEAPRKSIVNLEKHIEDIHKYHVPVAVTLDSFTSDTEVEYVFTKQPCEKKGCELALSEVWAKGGEGREVLAQKVITTLETRESRYEALYPDEMSLKNKIRTVATKTYRMDGISYTPAAEKTPARIEEMEFGNFLIYMAKTRYFLSDDQTKLGCPAGFTVSVRDVNVSAGTGFAVVLTGVIMTMLGLPKKPAAEGIDVNAEGIITGLFQLF